MRLEYDFDAAFEHNPNFDIITDLCVKRFKRAGGVGWRYVGGEEVALWRSVRRRYDYVATRFYEPWGLSIGHSLYDALWALRNHASHPHPHGPLVAS